MTTANLIIKIPALVCADSRAIAKISARVDKSPEAVRNALKFETFGEGPDEIRSVAINSYNAQLSFVTCSIPKPRDYAEG